MPARIADWFAATVNVLVQARAEGAVGGSLESMRSLVAATHEPETFLPRSTAVKMGP